MENIPLAHVGLITIATATIYAGAWGSLPSSPKHPSKGDDKDQDKQEDESFSIDERISPSEAYLFPIIASVGLFGLHLALKYLSKEWINWLFSNYFALIGIGSVWRILTLLLKFLVGKNAWDSFHKTQILLQKHESEPLRLSFRTPTLILLPFASIPSTIYIFCDRPALMTNILSLSFAFNTLCFLKLDSFKTGTVLLSGLFLYDIWWVFGTKVMVQVAKTLDAPIKVLWPNSKHASGGYMLLGLGDIVVPGSFITLALRRDLFASPSQNPHKAFEKPYFCATIVAYISGLSVTMYVMHISGVAQPALLYLSPACVICFVLTATIRGELKDVWNWTDSSQKPTGSRMDAVSAKVQN